MVNRVELVLLHEHPCLPPLEPLESDERIRARLGVQDAKQQLRINRNCGGLALLRPVDHRRDAIARPQPPGFVLAARLALFDLKC